MNSHERRQLRRMLREAGLGPPPPPPPPPPTPQPKKPHFALRVLGKIPKWLYAMAAGLAVFVGLFSLFPWLSIQQDFSFDPTNPYQTSFSLENNGYAPITNIHVECWLNFDVSQNVYVHDGTAKFDLPGSLYYKHRISLPCNFIYGLTNVKGGAQLRVSVWYRVFHVDAHSPQRFSFKASRSPDGTYHWEYID